MMRLLAICAFGLLIGASVLAQQNEGRANEEVKVFKHPLTDMPGPSDEVSTSYYFPVHGDLKLPIGEVVTTLCHFVNRGGNYYNISAIMGSLNAPFDFRHHFQNYSYKPIGMVVKSEEEITMQYSFQLHPDLEPVDYQLAITVFYESESQSFSSTFFNQTVELYSTVNDYDFETVSSVAYSLLSTIFVALVVIVACFPESKTSHSITNNLKKIFSLKSSSSGRAKDDSDQDDWTIVHHKHNKKQRRTKNETEETDEDGEER